MSDPLPRLPQYADLSNVPTLTERTRPKVEVYMVLELHDDWQERLNARIGTDTRQWMVNAVAHELATRLADAPWLAYSVHVGRKR